jgi:hypothetical protein
MKNPYRDLYNTNFPLVKQSWHKRFLIKLARKMKLLFGGKFKSRFVREKCEHCDFSSICERPNFWVSNYKELAHDHCSQNRCRFNGYYYNHYYIEWKCDFNHKYISTKMSTHLDAVHNIKYRQTPLPID